MITPGYFRAPMGDEIGPRYLSDKFFEGKWSHCSCGGDLGAAIRGETDACPWCHGWRYVKWDMAPDYCLIGAI